MTETEQMPLEKLVSTDLLHPGLPHTCYLSKKKKQTNTVCAKCNICLFFQYPQRWQMFNIYLIKKANS